MLFLQKAAIILEINLIIEILLVKLTNVSATNNITINNDLNKL